MGLKLRKLLSRRRLASQTPASEVGRFGGLAVQLLVGGLAAQRWPKLRKPSRQGGKPLRVLRFANAGDETSACVAFGNRIALMRLGHIWFVRANITPAHIWHPERAKRLSELTFSDFLKNTRFESTSTKGTITRPYAHAGLAARDIQAVP